MLKINEAIAEIVYKTKESMQMKVNPELPEKCNNLSSR